MLVERFIHRWLNGYSYMGIGCSMSLTYPLTRISRVDLFSIFEATALTLPSPQDTLMPLHVSLSLNMVCISRSF